jgi:hypothetical protein
VKYNKYNCFLEISGACIKDLSDPGGQVGPDGGPACPRAWEEEIYPGPNLSHISTTTINLKARLFLITTIIFSYLLNELAFQNSRSINVFGEIESVGVTAR